MEEQLKQSLPLGFADDSRVWIYLSNRKFTPAENLTINNMLEAFAEKWQSHGTPVKGFGGTLFSQFIVLMADENATGVSGCSTDSSVRLIKEIEKKFGLEMFNWQNLAFLKDGQVDLVSLPALQEKVNEGHIAPETLFFNNTVPNLSSLKSEWIVPVKESWLMKRVSF